MKIINLILHILTMIVMLPDLLFIGIAFLWGVQYLRGWETIYVPAFVMLFFGAFFYSLVGGVILFPKFRKNKNRSYMKHELIVHGLSALSFGGMLLYTLVQILHPAPEIPELTTHSEPKFSAIDITGFALAIAGIIISIIIGVRKDKITAAIAQPQAITQPQVVARPQATVQPQATAQLQTPVQGVQIKARPRFCSKCGTPTGTEGSFCRQCGSKLI